MIEVESLVFVVAKDAAGLPRAFPHGPPLPDADLKAPTHGVDLGAGLNVAFASGAVLALGANYFVYDNDLEGWYLSGGLGVPF